MNWDRTRAEASLRNEPGIEKLKDSRCPKGAQRPLACMFCTEGHMLECHYPLDCEAAQCSHLERYD